MAVSDYGGRQQGMARLEIDPVTGEQIVVYDDVEVSPTTQHQYGQVQGFLAPKKTNIGTYASIAALVADPFVGGGAGAVPAASAGSGGIPASVAGHTTALPTLGVTGPLPGVLPGSVPIGTGLSSITAPTVAGVTAPAVTSTTAGTSAVTGATTAPADLAIGAKPLATTIAPAAGSKVPSWLSGWKGDLLQTGIEAGLGIWASKRAKDAYDKAAKIQTEAGDRAIAENQQILGPYLHAGSQAENTLGGLMGFAPMSQPGPLMGGTSLETVGPRSRPEDVPPTGTAKPRTSSPDDRKGLIPERLLQPLAAQQQTQSSYVPMRDDEGRVVNVPAGRVTEFERLGARRA